jgi:methylthioribose-1-phosphate isomerase
VLTHCNTGALVSAGEGTAFAVIMAAHRAGRLAMLWVDETRPLLQGARLTAWELRRAGIPFRVVADSAAGGLIARGLVDRVVVGADRIAATGDVANKVGTYALAVVANRHDVPFYVAAPVSTIDRQTPRGEEIPIEERDPTEVAADGEAFNPAFDVTPADLVTAIFTEAGVLEPPYHTSIARIPEARTGRH